MYRKIRKYNKSIHKSKLERQRRKQVFELTQKGYSQSQIANQLGISTKTVHRDLQKLRGYATFLLNQQNLKIERMLQNRLDELPLETQFDFVTNALCASMSKNRRLESKLFWDLLSGKIASGVK